MNNMLKVQAPAKLNLTLDVLGKRPDGYHNLRMVMQSVSLSDSITLSTDAAPGIHVSTNLSYLPNNENNLAAKAASAFFLYAGIDNISLDIRIDKRIPVCAGTAGGSSDAAAVLRGLNQLYSTGYPADILERIGETVGSDVPYCVKGGTVLAEGKGEILTTLSPLPDCWFVLCKPGFSISTPDLFHSIDGFRLRHHPDTDGMIKALNTGNLREVSLRMYNVFEDVLPKGRADVIQEIKDSMLDGGALGSCMTGTGSTVYGLFTSQEKAEQTAQILKDRYRDTFLTQNIPCII